MLGKNTAYNRTNLYLLYIIAFLCVKVLGRINESLKENSEAMKDISNLRFLSFGASITWGTGVKDRLTETYPKILSPSATNLALRATGPNYPSICTQSMVGDEMYDVITLEYFIRASDGIERLAERLRERFPKAVIVFIQLWNPKMISYRENIHMNMWVEEKGLVASDPELLAAVEATRSLEWKFNMKPIRGSIEILEDTANAVNGYILKGPPFPMDNYETIDVKHLLLSTRRMFSDDWFHLSEEGHWEVARSIQALLQTLRAQRSDELGTWGKGDLCHKWYETGTVQIPFSQQVSLAQFKPSKHALQFPPEGGTITISNPFGEPRLLTACYMTTGPAPTIYPRTEILINGDLSRSLTVDPVCNDFDFPVHVSTCTRIGAVDPGLNVVSISPLETTQQPFRVVGVALTNGDEHMSDRFIGGIH